MLSWEIKFYIHPTVTFITHKRAHVTVMVFIENYAVIYTSTSETEWDSFIRPGTVNGEFYDENGYTMAWQYLIESYILTVYLSTEQYQDHVNYIYHGNTI